MSVTPVCRWTWRSHSSSRSSLETIPAIEVRVTPNGLSDVRGFSVTAGQTWVACTFCSCLTPCSSGSRYTAAREAIHLVGAGSTVQTWVASALIIICLTLGPSESRNTGTLEPIYSVGAGSTIQTWVASALIDICFTIFPCESLGTYTHITVLLVMCSTLSIVLTRPTEAWRLQRERKWCFRTEQLYQVALSALF